ncbi:MAG: Ig-like domain-containing protein [Lachnospiraceae bacterium]|nr:Ig-like domain-containing protein [Lachnospiraceae bacterium]
MSMPKFPENPDLNLEDSVVQIISSIAMEELALSHVLNAEGEKLQYVLGTLGSGNQPPHPPTVTEILKVNESVKNMLSTVSMNQMFLLGKMSSAMDAYSKLKEGMVTTDSVTILGGDQKINVGEKYTPKYEIVPPNSSERPHWSSSDESVAKVDQNGVITGVGEGAAIITITSGDHSDSITIVVTKPVSRDLPLKNGEGPYDTRIDPNGDLDKSFSLMIKLKFEYGSDIPAFTLFANGSIKLQDVLSGNDYDGLRVRPERPDHDPHFWIGVDKAGDPAIMYDCFPEKSVWEALPPLQNPVIEETLILSKPGFNDVKIRVILRYDGSLYSGG